MGKLGRDISGKYPGMRNPLHSICPYFAMFPEGFVQTQLLAYSRVGDLVYDPFCGRGTTILEGLLNDREAAGTDINPVAACISGAKAEIPADEDIFARIEALRDNFSPGFVVPDQHQDFFEACFYENTLQQILYLRSKLLWQDCEVDRFIAAVALGVLHGESHKTELCLSNRMPRTISTKPEYSVRWWNKNNCVAPDRNAFDVLEKSARYRLRGSRPTRRGSVALADARTGGVRHANLRGQVGLIVTSPPYVDTTDYAEDQWLRLWFLGGKSAPQARLNKDDRHTRVDEYWKFMTETWSGIETLLKPSATVVVRIGGAKMPKETLIDGLRTSMSEAWPSRTVTMLDGGQTSAIKRRQTNSFRPGTSPEKVEHDFTFSVAA